MSKTSTKNAEKSLDGMDTKIVPHICASRKMLKISEESYLDIMIICPCIFAEVKNAKILTLDLRQVSIVP